MNRSELMNIGSVKPMDEYSTTCAKCQTTISYNDGYNHNDQWYCRKCYRDIEPDYREPIPGRFGSVRNDRST
jgi:PHP family Zn ribbon phosphoesterase